MGNGQSDHAALATGERSLLVEGLASAAASVSAGHVGQAHRFLSPRALHTAPVSLQGQGLHTEDRERGDF